MFSLKSCCPFYQIPITENRSICPWYNCAAVFAPKTSSSLVTDQFVSIVGSPLVSKDDYTKVSASLSFQQIRMEGYQHCPVVMLRFFDEGR